MSTLFPPSPTAFRLKLLGVGLLAGAIALVFTNPSRSAYLDYAAERLPETIEQDCKRFDREVNLADFLELSSQALCGSLAQGIDFMGRGLVRQAVKVSTERQNWGVLSVYETQLPGRTTKTVGIAGRFWRLPDREG